MNTLVLDSLTPAQAQVVAALAQGVTITDAAKAAGLHRATIHNWLKHQPDFQCAVDHAKSEYAATLRDELQVLSRDALATLRTLLDDPLTPRALRFKVAMAILQRPKSPDRDWRLPEPVDEPSLSDLDSASSPARDQWSEVSNLSNVSNSVETGPSAPPELALTPRKTPRNQPCPCGSGRKYKKCCYLRSPAQPFATAA